MYENNVLNRIMECIEISDDVFKNKEKQLTALNTFILLMDKLDVDNFMYEYDFSEEEYNKYFKDIVKTYNKGLQKTIEQEFKDKEQ